MLRLPKLGLALTAGLFAAGCQTADKPAESRLVASDQGVMCEKCKTTWVKVPESTRGLRVIAYTEQKRHTCPDCTTAAQNFFATGKLEHSCKTCGDNMKVCEAH